LKENILRAESLTYEDVAKGGLEMAWQNRPSTKSYNYPYI